MSNNINHLRKYRVAANLTQAALGDLIGANQQLIQRIEAGISPARGVVAELIAEQLNLKVEQIFQALRKSIKSAKGYTKKAELGGLLYYLLVLNFKNGNSMNHIVSGEVAEQFYLELDRLGQENKNNYDFLVFDSETHRVAVNPRQLSHWRVEMHEGSPAAEVEKDYDDEDNALEIQFSNGTWTNFSSEPDMYSYEDTPEEIEEREGDVPMPLGDFFYYLEDEYSPLVSFTDLDDFVTHFQKSDIVIAQTNLYFVRPSFLDATDELDEERL
jgi:DNA-binding XRE family transcriptional regulator